MKTLIFIFSAVFTINCYSQWQQTSLDSMSIRCITISGNNIFAGTNYGLYLSTDNGNSWTNIGLSSYQVNAITTSGTSNIFAGTLSYGGGVFLSSNNGVTWTPKNNGLATEYIYKLNTNGSKIYAGTNSGFYYSSNNGNSWILMNNGLYWTDILTFAFGGASNIYAGTWGGGISLSTNNGASWIESNTGLYDNSFNAMLVNDTNIFAGSQTAGVFLSTNNAASWNNVSNGLLNLRITSLETSGGNIFSGTYGGGVYLSSDNGNNWADINSGLTKDTILSLAANGSNLFAGTFGGGVWRRQLSEFTEIKNTNINGLIIKVYPNPAKNYITIESPPKSAMKIYNIQGEQIISISTISNKTNLNVSSFPLGMYFVEVKTDKMFIVNKFVKE